MMHKANMIARDDGSLTADPAEMNSLVHEAWMPVFQMYASKDRPSWEDFQARFGQHFGAKHEMYLDDLDGQKLLRVLRRMRSKSAPGMDCWRVDELKQLPVVFLDRLACLFSLIEETGLWPDDLTKGIVSLISKGEGSKPTKLRPIGLMSCVYRLWAAARVGDVMAWQEFWIDKSMHGFRRCHGAEDVWWTQALAIEDALLQGTSLFGLSLDYGKCFDRVPAHLVLQLAERYGMSPKIVKPMQSLYARLSRRFRFGVALGAEFQSTNGIIQGCPLSVVLLNLLVSVWTNAVNSEVPDASPCGYADDTGMTSGSAGALQRTLNITGSFATVTGQVLNASKSKCWSTASSHELDLHGLTLMDEAVPPSKGGRLLGAHVAVRRGVRNVLGDARVKRGVAIADRIRWAPLPMHCRARLLASLVMPSTMYGFCVGGLTHHQIQSLTSAVMRAIWGSKRALRSKDVVLSLFVPGHLVDPRQVSVYQCLCTLRRFVHKCPDLHAMLLRCWEAYSQNCIKAPGPIGLVAKMITQLGWAWPEFQSFSRPGRSVLPLAAGPDSWWLHELRDGLQLARWSAAAACRQDMKGLDAMQGVDRPATLALLSRKALPPDESGILRGILSGSIRFQQRLYLAGLVTSPVCPFCCMCEETVFHCFWECPMWDALRHRYQIPCCRVRSEWPACTSHCGIFIEDRRVMTLAADLEAEQPILDNIDGCLHCNECRAGITNGNESSLPQVLWTDGASSNNQDGRFRRAGSGIYYGPDHALNYSCLLPGFLQSNQRAELFAVLLACLRDPRELDIRTDSEYVCKGVSTWRSWVDPGWSGESSDLWNLLALELRTRGTNVRVSWVKGHAKKIDIDRGVTTWEDKLGNDGADQLAVAGAKSHEILCDVLDDALQRKSCAQAVQGMMICIVKARMLEEARLSNMPAGQDGPDDRGSDNEDCLSATEDSIHSVSQ